MSQDLDPILFLEPSRLVLPDPWAGHIPFAFWLVKLLQAELIVELGTHTGNSACAFAHAQDYLDIDGETHAIDTWEGDEYSGFYEKDVYEGLLAFSRSNFNGRLQLRRSPFQDRVADYENESIAILHIDGSHAYEDVRRDFLAWREKVAPDGVILIHDVAVTQDRFGVRRFWREVAGEESSFELPGSYGLGVLMPGPEPHPTLARMAEEGAPTELLRFLSDRRDHWSLRLYLEDQLLAIRSELTARREPIPKAKPPPAPTSQPSSIRKFFSRSREN